MVLNDKSGLEIKKRDLLALEKFNAKQREKKGRN